MIGTRLGAWVLDRELGRGGMGTVYLAHRSPLTPDPSPPEGRGEGAGPEQAAVKVLAAELSTEAGFLARFQREIDILRQLDHPNIVRFLESGRQEVHSFFVMEYVPGGSYEGVLARQGRLPWPEVLELAWQIAPALKHAHDRGVIHRDLKPSNLLRAAADGGAADGKPLVKLTDFGIASLFASPHLTVTGGVVGTAEYLSPEQAAGKPVTRRSDLYSLGVVLYTLTTGRTPFVGEPLDLLHKHRFAQFDRPSRLVPEMPPELDAIICDLLAKDPAQRPADGAVLFRRLDSLRRKLAYQATHGGAEGATAAPTSATAVYEHPTAEGPATLMSRLMRQELEREKAGGPLRRFVNRPAVLVLLFVLTVGLLAWSFWPAGAESMYRRGAELMKSSDPADWETAWEQYLAPLLEKHPDTPHRAEVEQLRGKYEAALAGRQARLAVRHAGPMSEAQWFYQEGLRRRQQGDEAGARRLWRALVLAFGPVPSEAPWVHLAERELDRAAGHEAPERQWGAVREAVRAARTLREQGHAQEAEAIMNALRELYRGEKQAEAILRE